MLVEQRNAETEAARLQFQLRRLHTGNGRADAGASLALYRRMHLLELRLPARDLRSSALVTQWEGPQLVVTASPSAGEAGLHVGDVVLAVDGSPPLPPVGAQARPPPDLGSGALAQLANLAAGQLVRVLCRRPVRDRGAAAPPHASTEGAAPDAVAAARRLAGQRVTEAQLQRVLLRLSDARERAVSAASRAPALAGWQRYHGSHVAALSGAALGIRELSPLSRPPLLVYKALKVRCCCVGPALPRAHTPTPRPSRCSWSTATVRSRCTASSRTTRESWWSPAATTSACHCGRGARLSCSL